ncbi:MAG: hypothetical protein HW421_2855 [Ignavibacteria bacterium]|nr:hypothetical protein [Ignavibacteria bacterium]
MKKYLFILCLILLPASALPAQKEANNWFFGNYCGMTFNKSADCPNPPCAIKSEMTTSEGCSALSDANGNMLCYTNGEWIWNVKHQKMKNSDNLKANQTVFNSGFIVPNPGDNKKFYLFTLDGDGICNLYYSEIDFNNDPNGEINLKTKNTFLETNVTDRLSAVKHANSKDYWVLAHRWNSNNFIIYKLTENGIEKKEQSIGQVQAGDIINGTGALKFSISGKKMAMAIYGSAIIEYYSFDNSKGELSYIRNYSLYLPYGVEFSKDETKLYVASIQNYPRIMQYDLKDKYNNNGYEIARKTSFRLLYYFGALQIGPDGKIYISEDGYKNVGRIEFPDSSYDKCKYIESFLDVSDKNRYDSYDVMGLSSFPANYFSDSQCGSHFQYDDFNLIPFLSLTGAVNYSPPVLNLTQEISNQKSAVWYSEPVNVKYGFNMKFKFRISNSANYLSDSEIGADGIAFVIQNAQKNALGNANGGIGFAGIPNSLAVEFDTYDNSDDNHDPIDNHVAVFCNGTAPNTANHLSSACLGTNSDIIKLRPFKTVYYAQIDYNIETSQLKIFIDSTGKFDYPALTINNLDLSKLLNLAGGDKAFVGFTSSTGETYHIFDLLSWEYCGKQSGFILSVPEEIQSENNSEILTIYPNPAEYELMITLKIKYENYSLALYDCLGKEVRDFSNSNSNIINFQTASLNPGIYFLKFISGNFIDTKKVIIIK